MRLYTKWGGQQTVPPETCCGAFLETLVGCSSRQVWRFAEEGTSHFDPSGNPQCPGRWARRGSATVWSLSIPGNAASSGSLTRLPAATKGNSGGTGVSNDHTANSSSMFSFVSVQCSVTFMNLQLSDTLILHLLWVSFKTDICTYPFSFHTAFNSILLDPYNYIK